jgi:hypothetical protein
MTIVNNHRSGIDDEKFDFFSRDLFNVGITSSFPLNHYISSMRIIDKIVTKENGLLIENICLLSLPKKNCEFTDLCE